MANAEKNLAYPAGTITKKNPNQWIHMGGSGLGRELDANEVEKAKHIPAGAPYRHIPRAFVGTKPTHTDERCCAVNSYFNLTASPGIMSLTASQMAHFRQSIPGYVLHSPCVLHVDIYTHYPHRSAHIKKQNPRCMICMCQRERLPCTSFRSAPWEF